MAFKNRYQNKYNNKKSSYGGRMYDSIKEAAYAEEMDWLKKAGEITEIIPQFKIDIRVNDVHVCNYYIDFKITYANERVEYHEVKGFETDVWRLKWKLCKAIFPDNHFVLIK